MRKARSSPPATTETTITVMYKVGRGVNVVTEGGEVLGTTVADTVKEWFKLVMEKGEMIDTTVLGMMEWMVDIIADWMVGIIADWMFDVIVERPVDVIAEWIVDVMAVVLNAL